MLVGVPKEIKNHEYRVGLTPASVQELIHHGHQVLVEKNAGHSIGFTDELYERAGAVIAETAAEVFQRAEMIVKVKEPQTVERAMLREGQVLFTYLHLAPDEPQTRELMQSGATCIAYETVTDDHGRLPLLAPMSEVAGRMSIQAGAHCLEKYKGGRGVLLGGVPGVEPGHVVIIGGGVVGENAAAMAVGMGADVTILDRSVDVLRRLDARFGNRIQTQFSTKSALEELALNADMLVGAVLIPGASAPKLVTRELISQMKPGSAIVDVAIDQGGCCETSRPTTHADPIYMVDGVVHYCVANMPGAVARTSTLALNNATLPYALALADKGAGQALRDDPHLLNGLNVCQGKITCKEVSEARDIPYTDPASLIMDI
ncbi:alanine dehydrogenase [Sansalvadorimonas sp. 2012CJ34-2]|uniref:Alanine dehydrogenase n=1 Tax=Parendozoicomonas callyspongiae TaxID=2942213 RepID=A0ABT0PJI5_9GAMM|nr:alanine dehydrogenase [Sansalvadorimonas sp. 2012CJ34-2]MCL6271136.1 alanine dehydrogenase [Sansalvadorimonas sp. 2012CJ34-2]